MKSLNVSFSWSILNTERRSSNGCVLKIKYAVIGNYKEEKEGEWGVVNLTSPPEDLLIPYENLTETQVVGWVKTSLGATLVEEKEKAIESKIYENLYPQVLNGIPWE